MENYLTINEAWADFYGWMQKRKKNGDFDRMPADVQEANYAYTGRRPYGLGAKRIEALLVKYAPERYEFQSVVIVHE